MEESPSVRDHPLMKAVVRRSSIPTWVPWLPVGLAVLVYGPTLYLGLSAGGRQPPLLQFGWWGALNPLLGIEFGIVGALVLRRHPGHAVGWLAVAGGFCASLSAMA